MTKVSIILLFFIIVACQDEKTLKNADKKLESIEGGIYHIVMYGQSLMLGTKSVPLLSVVPDPRSLMFSGGVRSGYDDKAKDDFYRDFSPLIEKEVTSRWTGSRLGETPASGFSQLFYHLINVENEIKGPDELEEQDITLLISSPAQGSTTAKDLIEGEYWERLKKDISEGYRLAQSRGQKYYVPFVLWNQGETDIKEGTSSSSYKETLVHFQKKIDLFIKSATGQENPVRLVLYQTSSQNSYPQTKNPSTVAKAQYELAVNAANITMSNATYQLPYDKDELHFTNIGSKWNGFNHGLACKRILIDQEDWRPIYIKNTKIEKNLLEMIFHVPEPPLIIDTGQVMKAEGYGFSILQSESRNQIGIERVNVVNDSTIQLTTKELIQTGDLLLYGDNGHGTGAINGARGNIRDSQGDGLQMKIDDTTLVRIDNWLPILEIVL